MAERPSRTEERPFDVAVVGGGASGLAAALAAAREGARVCVIERDVGVGLSILATGNGRCNLSNAHLDPARYRHPEAFRAMAGATPEQELGAFFESVGLMLTEEDEGRLYPRSKRADSVRGALLAACTREGVRPRCGSTPVAACHDSNAGFWELALSEPAEPLRYRPGRDARTTLRRERQALKAAELTERTVRTRTVVIACGGACSEVAGLFGLPHLAEQPVLCPIACTPVTEGAGGAPALDLEALDGLRVEGELTLVRNGGILSSQRGEVLFRPYGVSGIAAFNLSRRFERGDELVLDLFPEFSEVALCKLLRAREEHLGALSDAGPDWFDGLVAPILGAQVHAAAARDGHDPVARAAALSKRLRFSISGAASPETAQVRRGGIPLRAIELSTCSVRTDLAPALFAAGEALDQDADCGGFNLAWAWLSGLRAGRSAARYAYEKDHA